MVKVDYNTQIGNALVLTLVECLYKPTNKKYVYIRARERLQEYVDTIYSSEEIDGLTKKILLKNKKFRRLLEKVKTVRKNLNNKKLNFKLENLRFYNIYNIFIEIYRNQKFSLKNKEHVPEHTTVWVPPKNTPKLGSIIDRRIREGSGRFTRQRYNLG